MSVSLAIHIGLLDSAAIVQRYGTERAKSE